MRSVQFSKRVELGFAGNIHPSAVVCGDVDNDGCGEIAVGSVGGQLAVFKGPGRNPWWQRTDVGSVTTLAVGDLLNTAKPVLLCANAEGVCFVFQPPPLNSDHDQGMQLTHKFHIPVNVKVSLIACLGDDGIHELFVGRTDRIVHAYRFDPATHTLIETRNWILNGQIGSISTTKDALGNTLLCIAQPSGTFVSFTKDGVMSTFSGSGPKSETSIGSTELIGGLLSTDETGKSEELIAVVTLDGIIKLCRLDTPLWELQVDHQLFAISKLPLVDALSEELIACAWDGTTYILDKSRNMVKFYFDDEVCAFTAGFYAVEPGINTPCLVYVTFKDQIMVYYDIKLKSVKMNSLLDKVPPEIIALVGSSERAVLEKRFYECLYHHQ